MKKLKKSLLILLVLLVTACSLSPEKLEVDYYSYINAETIEKHALKPDEYYWGSFTDAQDKVNEQVDSIILDLITTNANPNIAILYNQIMDTTTRDNAGLSPLNYYLNLIDNSSNITEFTKNATIIENDLGIPIFTTMIIARDFKDTTQNMIYLYPVNFDFGAPADYYVDEDYMSYKALVKQYGIKLLKLYGYDKTMAREVSKNITDYYTEISQNSKMYTYFNDIENMYNLITKDDLKKIYTNLNSEYFELIPDNVNLSLLDQGNYAAINASLTNENLATLKESVKLKILQSYCQYLSEDYAKVANDFENEQLGITSENTPEYLAKKSIKNFFQYDIDYYYDQKYLNSEARSYVESMIEDILNYYGNNINNLEWLSSITKEKAVNKVKNITVNIGLAQDYPKYSINYNLSTNNTLIENILKILKVRTEYEYQRLQNNNPTGSLEQTTVNAYYNPQDNSINFPSATITLVDFEKSYYQNLGTIGMIIAHEVTHAFDSNGSKFDENGNLYNWWLEEDRKSYEQLQEKVVEYYNQYEVIPGNYLNGELTVDENIADLGAVACISGIATEKNATTEEIRNMYESFANFWIEKSTDEYTKMLLLVDNHSPGKYRVNATLASTPTFYEVYNVAQNNPMYVAEENRLKIW